MKAAPPSVEVLSLPGCPNVEETLRVVGEVLLGMLPGTVATHVVLDERRARERGFPGSPTVLVDGRDIEGSVPRLFLPRASTAS